MSFVGFVLAAAILICAACIIFMMGTALWIALDIHKVGKYGFPEETKNTTAEHNSTSV